MISCNISESSLLHSGIFKICASIAGDAYFKRQGEPFQRTTKTAQGYFHIFFYIIPDHMESVLAEASCLVKVTVIS